MAGGRLLVKTGFQWLRGMQLAISSADDEKEEYNVPSKRIESILID